MNDQEKKFQNKIQKQTNIRNILIKSEEFLVEEWIKKQSEFGRQQGFIRDSELRQQSKEFLHLFIQAFCETENNIHDSVWDSVKQFLGTISRSRTEQGFTPSEIAGFIFSLKHPLFKILEQEATETSDLLLKRIFCINDILDKLGLYTVEVFQKSREELILRQQQDMLELSTPVVSLAEGILALPLIGTLDSERTQVVMESLLNSIVQTASTVAIIDITGVPTVDTLVAQHLLKTVTAARLMGTECIISGIRPQIAQTIVHLGVDLGNIITKASLATAFKTALEKKGLVIARGNSVSGVRT